MFTISKAVTLRSLYYLGGDLLRFKKFWADVPDVSFGVHRLTAYGG